MYIIQILNNVIAVDIELEYMGAKENITTIPVRKDDHRKARKVKRQGETWSLFLRRAAEALDEDSDT